MVENDAEVILICVSYSVSPAYSVRVIFKVQTNGMTDTLICALTDTAKTS